MGPLCPAERWQATLPRSPVGHRSGPQRGRPGEPMGLAVRDLIADTRGVSVDAAFVAIVVAFAAGWLTRRWRGAENGLRVARRGADLAGGATWRARLWFAGAVILVWGLADLWIHSH